MYDDIGNFPTPVDNFFPAPDPAPPDPPAPPAPPEPPVSDAERKRVERQARKSAGLPDPRTVDVAIVGALVAALDASDVLGHIRSHGSVSGVTLNLEPILRDAMASIRRAKVNGAPVTRLAAATALQQRLRLRQGGHRLPDFSLQTAQVTGR